MNAASPTTKTGYVNRNGQVTIRNSNLAGNDHLQSTYQMACSHGGNNYGSNGSDIFERKCPKCQGGRPGLAFTGDLI
jgi:hypothetical protein